MRSVFKNLCIDAVVTDIVSENGTITHIGRVDADGIDMKSMEVRPGLVDIHTHGIGGTDTMDGDVSKLSQLYADNGVTSFCPTTMTEDFDKIVSVTHQNIADAPGAEIIGFHIEGPFISKNRLGAQNPEYVRRADYADYKRLGNVSLITVAPETEGALEFIRKCEAKVAIGHTDATYEEALLGFDAGADCVTHVFNAMPPLHHRLPGVFGAAFDRNAYVQVICDGVHIHPSVVRMIYKLFGAERMILISDSMCATGVSDGEYIFGGSEVVVKDGVARIKDTGALAGSTSTLMHCVKCAEKFGIPRGDAFRMASETPAKYLGLSCGKLAVGYKCDFIVMNGTEKPEHVVINGELYR